MRKYYCHRCGGTSEYGEWIDDMPLQNCYWYDCGRCKASIVLDAQCDAARYVRADVAIRYASMAYKKGYKDGNDYAFPSESCDGEYKTPGGRELGRIVPDEAQQKDKGEA